MLDVATRSVVQAQILVMVFISSLVWISWHNRKVGSAVKMMLISSISIITQAVLHKSLRDDKQLPAWALTVIGFIVSLICTVCLMIMPTVAKLIAGAVFIVFALYVVAAFWDRFTAGEWWYIVVLILGFLLCVLIWYKWMHVFTSIMYSVATSAFITYGSADLSRWHDIGSETFVEDMFGAKTCRTDANGCLLRLSWFVGLFLFRVMFILTTDRDLVMVIKGCFGCGPKKEHPPTSETAAAAPAAQAPAKV